MSLTDERLIGAVVRAGIKSDILNNAACGLPVTPAQASIPGAHIPILCDPPVIARYVSVDDDDHIDHPDHHVLTLCEMTVEEYPMEDCLQITSKKENRKKERKTRRGISEKNDNCISSVNDCKLLNEKKTKQRLI